MRKLGVVVVVLAVFAVACGGGSVSSSGADGASDSGDSNDASAAEDQAQVATSSTADDGSPDAGSPDADSPDEGNPDQGSTADEAATGEAEAAGDQADPDASPCGFGSGAEPEDVEVVQIEGEGRDRSPSALAGAHPDFPDPLVNPDEIISGGPPPDGIPPIDRPRFQTAASVDWLHCNEPVLALEIDGEARAYPLQIMTWHEIVNDTFGDVPVSVSFCPLCNSALVYRRDVDGRVLDFGTSGRLYNSSLVMWDRQTESLWTHFNGTAVVGALTGTELTLLPVQTTSWQNFVDLYPDGIVLTRDTGFTRSYGSNPYGGYDTTETNPFLFRGELDDRLAAKERVVSIGQRSDSVAVVLADLAAEGVVAAEVDGRSLTVWHQPGTSSALDTTIIAQGKDVGAVAVFVAEIDGQPLTFAVAPDSDIGEPRRFVDAETASVWDHAGRAIEGELAGRQLEPVEHLNTFWFAIAAFEPDTRILRAP